MLQPTLRLALALQLLVLTGCGDDVIYAQDYDQSCSEDSDCVVVQEGDPCCGCPNAAINERELDRYAAGTSRTTAARAAPRADDSAVVIDLSRWRSR